VRYRGEDHIVRGLENPARHPHQRVRELPALWEAYPDGHAYELWPAVVPYLPANDHMATTWVRRGSFETEAERVSRETLEREKAECTCVHDCADDPATACSLSGEWHVHPEEPCPVHPDAPGDRQVPGRGHR
jgi:hypothetical protein